MAKSCPHSPFREISQRFSAATSDVPVNSPHTFQCTNPAAATLLHQNLGWVNGNTFVAQPRPPLHNDNRQSSASPSLGISSASHHRLSGLDRCTTTTLAVQHCSIALVIGQPQSLPAGLSPAIPIESRQTPLARSEVNCASLAFHHSVRVRIVSTHSKSSAT